MPSKRINNIIDYLTYEIYLYIQRGLFERHKLIFALMLTNKILVSAGKTKVTDVDIFLKGGGALDINSVRKKPKDWILDSVWLSIVALSSMDSFRDLPDSVFRNDGLWRQWYDQEAPEQAKVPDYEDRLSKFERMCIVKTFREDRTLIAAGDYIADALGQRFVESVPLNMERAHAESHSKCPLICLLSPGADPTKLIEDLAKKKKIKTLGVSMGQGQEIIARKYMATASLEGQWVLLQNTHLGLGYLTEVETYLVKEENIHEDFRLWITAEPHPQFPIGLLQMGIKVGRLAVMAHRRGRDILLTSSALPPADHQRGPRGHEGRPTRLVPMGHAGHAGRRDEAGVEAAALRHVLPALGHAGEAEVRAHRYEGGIGSNPGNPEIKSPAPYRLERAVRVQPERLVGLRAVPPGAPSPCCRERGDACALIPWVDDCTYFACQTLACPSSFSEPLDGDGCQARQPAHLGDGSLHD